MVLHGAGPGEKTGAPHLGYAILIDLDPLKLETAGGPAIEEAESVLCSRLDEHGFDSHRGSLHLAPGPSDAVSCIVAIQDLADDIGWFAEAAREVRMLRIEADDDAMPAVCRVVRSKSAPALRTALSVAGRSGFAETRPARVRRQR